MEAGTAAGTCTAAGTAAATRSPTPGLRSNRGTPTITRSIASRSSTSLLNSSDGERVELGAMTDDQPARGAACLVDQLAALLVAQAQRGLREAHVAVRGAPDTGTAHRVVVHHRVRDVRHALEVIRCAGGDRAEHDLLGHTPPQQDGHVVE